MSLTALIEKITMGCFCGKEAIVVEGRRFYIRSRLGEGGFSFVDLVEEADSGKLHALKRITCHSKEDEKLALEEVQFMKNLNHHNLIPCECAQLIPVNTPKSSQISEVALVMPFYRKGSLWDEIEYAHKRNESIPIERLLRLFRGICEGLKYLHTHTPNPLAHRDMKPHNVMLEMDDNPVLMDFGSMGPARVEIKTASQGRAMQDLAAERCTMPYRAPELFNVETGSTVDEKVDIWSLGCVLYAMCFHESPFDKAYARGDSIALAVLSSSVTIPENSGYSESIGELITSMLIVDPSSRPDIQTVLRKTEFLRNEIQNRI